MWFRILVIDKYYSKKKQNFNISSYKRYKRVNKVILGKRRNKISKSTLFLEDRPVLRDTGFGGVFFYSRG